MKITLSLFAAAIFLAGCKDTATNSPEVFRVTPYESAAVVKSNPAKVYAHYMPWFESKEVNGKWGIHWTMATRDPENIVDGKREIASHFYPLIGPYSSIDPDVIEYHLLLMKLCGIDGVLIDWYGSYEVSDYKQNRSYIWHCLRRVYGGKRRRPGKSGFRYRRRQRGSCLYAPKLLSQQPIYLFE